MREVNDDDLSIVGALLAYEIDMTKPPDGRRVMRDERLGVEASAQLYASGRITAADVRRRVAEAHKTLALWPNN